MAQTGKISAADCEILREGKIEPHTDFFSWISSLGDLMYALRCTGLSIHATIRHLLHFVRFHGSGSFRENLFNGPKFRVFYD
jgi:hypothetical protein